MLIDRRTGDLGAALLGHSKIECAIGYPDIEAYDAIESTDKINSEPLTRYP